MSDSPVTAAENLTRRLPLEGRHHASAAVRLEPAASASRISLRVRREGVAPLSEALGLALPERPKRSASDAAGLRHALWLGPDEWLVIDESAASVDLVAIAAGSGVFHSAVDVSHRNTAIEVAGRAAEATLNGGCPQDLSLRAFPVGACSRTVLGKIEIVLWRGGPDTFRVECWRSFSDYAFTFLEAAARDADL